MARLLEFGEATVCQTDPSMPLFIRMINILRWAPIFLIPKQLDYG